MCFGTIGTAPAPPNCRKVAVGLDSRNTTVVGPVAVTSAMVVTGCTITWGDNFWAA